MNQPGMAQRARGSRPPTLNALNYMELEEVLRFADAVVRVTLVSVQSKAIKPSPQDYPSTGHYDNAMLRGAHQTKVTLVRRIQMLSKDALIELTTLFWFGRGDAPLSLLRNHAEKSDSTELPYYLASQTHLAAYLMTGLQKLERGGF